MAHCPVISWKPLGELLVERGFITAEQLDDALAEQAETGVRLGAILVARKAVAGVVLTTVLAEQVGLALETQQGFGSGLFSKIAERHGAPPPEAAEPRSAAPAARSDHLTPAFVPEHDPAYELSALRAELEMLRERNEQLEAELTALTSQRSARRTTSAKRRLKPLP